VARFGGTAREAVHVLKYHGRFAIGGLLGTLMAQAAVDTEADIVVPVPLHTSRKRERGYDQAALLARALARELKVPCETDRLRRTRPTAQQATLQADERHANVAGAFEATGRLDGSSVLLVDDVMTTGATMSAAAVGLTDAGASRVIGVVFAHAQ
jgi:ComF family protein